MKNSGVARDVERVSMRRFTVFLIVSRYEHCFVFKYMAGGWLSTGKMSATFRSVLTV